jgi:hypothetical protein
VKNFVIAMMVVAIATPAYAQMVMPNLEGPDRPKLKTDVEIKQEQDRENGFKAGLKKIPDQKAKVDPWGDVRGNAPPPSQGQARPK